MLWVYTYVLEGVNCSLGLQTGTCSRGYINMHECSFLVRTGNCLLITLLEVVIVVVHRHRDCWYHEHARLLLLIRLHWHSLRHHWLNGLHLLLHLHLLHLHWLHPNDSPLCWLLWLLHLHWLHPNDSPLYWLLCLLHLHLSVLYWLNDNVWHALRLIWKLHTSNHGGICSGIVFKARNTDKNRQTNNN